MIHTTIYKNNYIYYKYINKFFKNQKNKYAI